MTEYEKLSFLFTGNWSKMSSQNSNTSDVPYEKNKTRNKKEMDDLFLNQMRETKAKLKKKKRSPKPKDDLKQKEPIIARVTRSQVNSNFPLPSMLHCISEY